MPESCEEQYLSAERREIRSVKISVQLLGLASSPREVLPREKAETIDAFSEAEQEAS